MPEQILTGRCSDCGMLLDSRYNDFDVDDTISGFYWTPDGDPVCRDHRHIYDDDDQNDEEEH